MCRCRFYITYMNVMLVSIVLLLSWELFIWEKSSHPCKTSHLSEISAEWCISICKSKSFIWEWIHPTQVGQPGKNCLHGEKSSHLSEISPAFRWDLSWVGRIHAHINDLLLQSEIHNSAEMSLWWDVSPGWDDFSHTNSS